ncbi:MAG: hypothetical protein K2W85_04215 [Phycisphaerales bacterium]|nr:hypothetical protein [Phycisphaerales bacterium]
MAGTNTEKTAKIDALMEQSSAALVKRDYFAAERLASSALRRAYAAGDFERMARIVLPLQEARRQKRDLAVDSGKIYIVDSELPQGKTLKPGCYLISPPRVGVDGRLLREMADEREVPTVVIVREPPSREGLWPIVAVGPVTVRTKVAPPPPAKPAAKKKPAKPTATKKGKTAEPAEPAVAPVGEPVLTTAWFLSTSELLGDAAIAQIAATLPAASRVDALMDRLEAHPDHEKLHQRLAEACREAILEPARKRRALDPVFFEDDELGGPDDEP